MTETPLHTQGKTQSPFQEEISLENYYATKSSENVLNSIKQAVADNVRLLVLSGDEGSGKNMLCHMLDQDPQKDFTTVFFPRTVDSFEDVVRIVALALGLELQLDGNGRNVDTLLDEISSSMIAKGVPVLLLFDEAENIYLATLERIRKMLDRISADGGQIHVLFAGRNTFIENCQQLSMCAFKNNDEYHITLEPISEEELTSYLYHCSSKFSEVDGASLFTPEVVGNIYQLSGGNFRMTNILAEEALLKDGDNSSFMVLLENVKEDVIDGKETQGALYLVKQYVDQYRSYLPYAGAGVGLVLFCLILLFSKDKPVVEVAKPPPVIQEVEQTVPIKIEVDKPTDILDSTSVKRPNVQPVEEVVSSVANSDEELAISSDLHSDEQLPEVEIDIEQQTKFSEAVIEVAPVVKKEIRKEEAPEPIAPVIVASLEPPKDVEPVEVVTLLRDKTTKKRPGKLPKTTQVTIKEEIKKEKSRNEVREVIASNAHFTVEQLYKKRLMAGSSWYNNKKNDKYTVQLLVLTSKTAEGNLKKMLQEERYRQQAGNFYIFKKLSTSDTIFVFYGEYRTIAQARLAQNSLPQFLRDHKPYAVSIKGAMAKVRR